MTLAASVVAMDVALIEDSVAIERVLVSRLAQIPGVSVSGSARGEAGALELIRRTAPGIVLLDLSLGEGDGWKVLERSRVEGYRGAILIFSNLDLPEYRQAASARGADGFFCKSTDLDALMQEVARRV